ncbi:MAG: pilus assembly protein PilX [Burkholderiales bacterium]|nr:pilus assembly protein PilX [Burkholderiales bacterium]
MKSSLPSLQRRRERGVSLIVILVMILALAFIALGAMSSSAIQERMAGNERDRNVALQAAEAALRDGEADVQAHLDASSPFSLACVSGLCMPPSETASGATSAPIWQTIDWATQSRAYGSQTGAPPLVGPDNVALASQPAYIVERLPELAPCAGCSRCSTCGPSINPLAFRITARATGVRPTTVVILQSTYVKQ